MVPKKPNEFWILEIRLKFPVSQHALNQFNKKRQMPTSNWNVILSLILLFSTNGFLFGQYLNPKGFLSGIGNIELQELTTGNNQTLYLGFTYDAEWQFGSFQISHRGKQDVGIAKLDQGQSTPAWVYTIGDAQDEELTAMEIDSENNLVIAGSYRVSLNIEDTTFQSTQSSKALFMAKFSPEGDLKWIKHLTGGGLKEIVDIKIDRNNQIWLLGYFEQSLNIGLKNFQAIGRTDGFLLQIDPNGLFVQGTSFGGGGDVRPAKLEIHPTGSLIVGGTFNKLLSISSTTIEANTDDNDLFLASFFAPNLSINWLKKAGGVLDKYLADLKIDQKGDILLFGHLIGVMQLDATKIIQSLTGNEDLFLAKYDFEGNALRAKAFRNEQWQEAKEMVVSNGSIWVSGTYQEPWLASQISFPEQPTPNTYFLELNEAFEPQKGKIFDTKSGNAFITKMLIQNNEVLIGTTFNGIIQFDNKTRKTAIDGFDSFWATLSNELISSISHIPIDHSITITPNPATRELRISADHPITRISCTSMFGHNYSFPIDNVVILDQLPRGTYLFNVLSTKGRFTQKITLQ